MNAIQIIVQSMIILGGLGAIVGIILVSAARKFKVNTDPLIEEVIEVLPGANCGACGCAGCADFAEQVVNESIPINGCPVGGFETAKKIGNILGKTVEGSDVKYPIARCIGGVHCKDRFEYIGIEDCMAVMSLSDGEKECNYGCMGRGTCVRVCPFNAITIGEDRLPHINKNLCKSCGICITSCPNNILAFAKDNEKVHVLCRSNDKGAHVKQICEFGCIGCKICVKSCPVDAIEVTGLLAEIDQEKCSGCGACVEKCPRNVIKIVEGTILVHAHGTVPAQY